MADPGCDVTQVSPDARPAAVLRIDNSVLIDDAEIPGQPAKRGAGDEVVWRCVFTVSAGVPRPTTCETIQLRLADRTIIAAVVTEVANGKMPPSAEC